MTDEFDVKIEFVDDQGINIFDFDYSAIDLIKKRGYPEAYILENLRHDQLNHVTTFYNLLVQKCDF